MKKQNFKPSIDKRFLLFEKVFRAIDAIDINQSFGDTVKNSMNIKTFETDETPEVSNSKFQAQRKWEGEKVGRCVAP